MTSMRLSAAPMSDAARRHCSIATLGQITSALTPRRRIVSSAMNVFPDPVVDARMNTRSFCRTLTIWSATGF